MIGAEGQSRGQEAVAPRLAAATATGSGAAAGERVWPFVVLAAACLLAFAPCLTFNLLVAWDDQVYILENRDGLRFCLANLCRWAREPFFANYHPLTMYTYMVDYALWGVWGPGYHLQNLLWHVAAAAGAFVLGRRLGLSPPAALTAAVLWAVHPLRVESVAWVAERKDVLCAALYVWGLVAAADGMPRRDFRLAAFLLFVLAFMAKAMAVSFPVVLLCLSWHLRGRPAWRAWLCETWPYFAVLALMLPVTWISQELVGAIRADAEPGRHLAVAWLNLFRYVGKTLVPRDLLPVYPTTVVDARLLATAGLCTLGGVAGLALLARRRPDLAGRVLLPALLAYAALLAPVSGIVALGKTDFADRYSYLPTLPLFLLLGGAVQALSRTVVRRCLPAAVSAAGVLLAATTFLGCLVWQDLESVYGLALRTKDPNILLLYGFRNDLIVAGMYDEALWVARYGQMKHPRLDGFRLLEARALDKLGRKREALRLYETLLPKLGSAEFHADLADCYRDVGNPKRAELLYTFVLHESPANYAATLNRGVARHELGRYAQAEADLRSAARLDPSRPEPLLDLAQLLHATGRRAEALAVLQDACRRFPEARAMLGRPPATEAGGPPPP